MVPLYFVGWIDISIKRLVKKQKTVTPQIALVHHSDGNHQEKKWCRTFSQTKYIRYNKECISATSTKLVKNLK